MNELKKHLPKRTKYTSLYQVRCNPELLASFKKAIKEKSIPNVDAQDAMMRWMVQELQKK